MRLADLRLADLTPSASFLSAAMAEKYNVDVPHYEGVDQIAEISVQNGTG